MNVILSILGRNDFSGSAKFVFVGWLIIVVAVWVWSIRWNIKVSAESKKRLAQWASESGWQIVQCEKKYRPGPFGWITGRATIYLRFVAHNQYDKRRVGWASFDHSLFAKGRMDVRWGDK